MGWFLKGNVRCGAGDGLDAVTPGSSRSLLLFQHVQMDRLQIKEHF